ncbi:3,4-dihydroxy-2-butanone-4-phosphate synthase RIB3 [Sugiyamaella lignohabitans]|uniref:3,4-dihydroxy-2-butanone 4-phosphate synthase n=1 Tax=Sugiyamaella lignohabitans TaxID=796027 RepID=A0A167DZ59_9ASCO|nr:3,4-dihydroxy-2-butanone-4-phosphate synthase RIB3 [Sugiyamaella lignohabitans]ANB13464.1 3,4-dihydroxy-2-butanone-4-phosphate synthase RIB3 [Sugiyamaella lignohabitans]
MSFDSIPDAIKAYKEGQFLVVLDDESRENEGDLIIAASQVTTEKMAFLVRYSSGYVCAPVSKEIADRLELPLMLADRSDRHGTAYTVSVDFAEGTTTGISAHDRALTARKLADPTTKADDFLKPGHLLPLRAVDGGVLARRGHTEAAVDLSRLAGFEPAGVICEIVRDEDGLMARRDDCLKFAKEHNMKIITIDALVEHLKSASS